MIHVEDLKIHVISGAHTGMKNPHWISSQH